MKNTDRRGDGASTTHQTSTLRCHDCGERNREGENVDHLEYGVEGQIVVKRWVCSTCLGLASIHQCLQSKFAELKAEFPTVTFGYIGNCGVDRSGRFDDRSWYIFLPTNGRAGSPSDRVGGYDTKQLGLMLDGWDKIVNTVRAMMVGR